MPRRRGNYSDESSDDDDGGRARKRRRPSDSIDIEERLESLITRVGEKSSSSLESNLEGLASVLEADLSNYKTKILKILLDCVVTMPERMTVYTTLVGLLNSKNYNAGGDFVDLLVRHLKESLKNGEHETARLVVRFLSDLANCYVVQVSSLISLYNNFIEVTLEDNIPQVRSDWFVYAILSSLPWSGRELVEKKEQDLERLLGTIDTYIQKRHKIHVPALRVWTNEDGQQQEEYLDCLWAQIQNMHRDRWIEHQILRPYVGFDSVLSNALQHTIPQLMIPSHDEDSTYPLPTVVFNMFDYTDVPEGPALPGKLSIERWLLVQYIDGILHRFWDDKKKCAEALLTFPSKNKIPLNYMIVEVVFAQLFQLPRPPYLELFYGSLLIELCKLQPGSMPQVLAQATEILFEKLDSMNTSCVERFANWFSYHLSNFQFKWSWEDWDECLQMNDDLRKPTFVRETLLKCLRLSYHQRVSEIVPASFAKMLPIKPSPMFKYEREGSGSLPGTVVVHKLMSAVRSKCSVEDALDILTELPNPLSDDEGYNPLKIEVFVQSLLFLAAKSFSHSFAAISKFHPILKSLGEARDAKTSEEAQICILRSLFELWRNHPQMLVVIVDKLLKTQVVECSAVANFIFSPEMSSDLTSFYVWEILHSTIKKMNKQVTKLTKEIEDMRDKVEEHDKKIKEGYALMDDDEDAADVPTEEMIEREEDKLDDIQKAQKNLFLIIFQRFIMILTEHLAQCEADGRDYATSWYKWIIERLQQVFLMHHEQVYKYINTLENLMFTSDIDIHVLQVFQQFCALRS